MPSLLSSALETITRLLILAARIFFAFCIVLISSVYRALRRNMRLKPIPRSELPLPLLAARLADLPYQVDSFEQVKASIATLLVDSKLFHFQEQELMQTHAVWFLCEGRLNNTSEMALFLVFRGTMSPTDAIADIMFRPETGPNGVDCHGGFLRTVRDDATLHKILASAFELFDYSELYILGHSLGGALSQVVAGAGFLPKTFGGKLTVVSLGGPVTFFGRPDAGKFDRATANARILSIVNSNDIVPRLLGCPLSFTRTLLALFASSNNHKKQQEQRALLDTLEKYTGFDGYELLFVHNGSVYNVPPADRPLVLHLAEALHPRLVADHLSYVDAIEAASGATHWTAVTSD